MSTFPWLTVAGAIPLVGAVAVSLTPGLSAPGAEADRRARAKLVKVITLVVTLVTLAVTIAMATQFKTGAGAPDFQFNQVYQWIPQFGVHYAVGVDGIALVLILMTTVLMPAVVLASWNDAEGEGNPAARPPGSTHPPRRSTRPGRPPASRPRSSGSGPARSRPRRPRSARRTARSTGTSG
jgi:NADH-quinone oxidoreductase subunit M